MLRINQENLSITQPGAPQGTQGSCSAWTMDGGCDSCKKWCDHFFEEHCDAKFLKVATGDFSDGMIIPEEFIKRYKLKLAEAVRLKGPSGYAWRVILSKAAKPMFFGDIWKQFLIENRVKEGDSLVFKYDGHSCFRVTVFDESGIEKISPSFMMGNFLHTEFHQREESEDQSREFSSSGRSLDSTMELPLSSASQKRQHHKRKERASETQQTMICSKRVKTEVNKVLQETPVAKKFLSLSVLISNRRTVTDAEIARTLKRAYKMRLPNPSVLTVMQPTHVYRTFFMAIPHEFAKNHIPTKKQMVSLRLPNCRKEWHVCYGNRSRSSFGFTGITWMQFVHDNNLEEGDACVFEITQISKTLVMDVHIFRVVEEVAPFTVERT